MALFMLPDWITIIFYYDFLDKWKIIKKICKIWGFVTFSQFFINQLNTHRLNKYDSANCGELWSMLLFMKRFELFIFFTSRLSQLLARSRSQIVCLILHYPLCHHLILLCIGVKIPQFWFGSIQFYQLLWFYHKACDIWSFS